MEATKEQELEIYKEVIQMMNQGRPEPEIRTTLRAKGLDDVYINTVLVNVYNHRNGVTVDQAQEQSSGAGSRNMLFGALWCIGGLIATAATDGQVLFYGAIIVGGIQFIGGVVQAATNR